MESKMQSQTWTWKLLYKKYNVHPKTFKKMIEPIKDEVDALSDRKYYRILTPKQVERIVEYLGEPSN